MFLSRFFENETARGPVDVTHSFIWLIAILATPGIFLPLYHTAARWAFIAARDGVAEARLTALFDKALYLHLTLVAMGILATMVWHTLIVNRRDALVLSALPIPPRAIVLAKLGALGTYVAVVAIGMHGIASVFYGGFLGSLEGLLPALRDVSAQFLTCALLGVWVFATVAALQSVCLLLAGPRHFSRFSIALQLLVVGAVMTVLLFTPLAAFAARGTLTGVGGGVSRAWLLDTPGYWFLGLQEAIAGSAAGQVPMLAARALLALGASLLVLMTAYPFACARVLRAAMQEAPPRGAALPRRIAAHVTSALATEPAVRAAVQFFLATTTRVHGHRLTLAIAAGIGLIGAITAVLVASDTALGRPAARPTLAFAAAPHYLVFALCVGLRIVASMPSELAARWPFDTTPMRMLAGRIAIRRVMLAFGVLLPILVFTPAWAIFWGTGRALVHAAGSLVAGAALVEALLWGVAYVPGTRAGGAGDSRLATRGIAGVLGFVVFVSVIPDAQRLLHGMPVGPYFFLLLTGLIWLGLRLGGDDAARVHALTDDEDGLVLLDLTMPTRPPARVIVGTGAVTNGGRDARGA